ncbi:hypothetical protein MRX96_039058 [Rhipicephalus microplus]
MSRLSRLSVHFSRSVIAGSLFRGRLASLLRVETHGTCFLASDSAKAFIRARPVRTPEFRARRIVDVFAVLHRPNDEVVPVRTRRSLAPRSLRELASRQGAEVCGRDSFPAVASISSESVIPASRLVLLGQM